MPESSACPNIGEYQRLATGQLGDAEQEAVLEHLEGCDTCAQQLNTLPEQATLAGLIRQADPRADQADEGTIARLVERLSKLRPENAPIADGPTMPPAFAALTFACPACGKGLRVKANLAGKKVKCPQCQAAVRVPAGSADMGEPTITQEPVSAPDKALYDFLAEPQAADELGRLGPYRVLEVLGAGGMGVVFRAEDPHLERLVALKAMLPALAASDSARQRFLREAKAAAAVKHDHIVTIHQVSEDRGVPFLAMEFLEGEPLDARLEREGELPVAEVLRIGRETALGMAAAHKRGLIHRDIKPANIWLETLSEPRTSVSGRGPLTDVRGSDSRVKILDFGLARASGEESKITQLGAIVGTPAYMAPEQAQGKTIDQRCDLFSLGCVLYRMATGEAPFKGTDMISTLMAVSTESPRPPVSLNFELPTELSDFIMQLLAKNPDERPGSAQLVAETLARIAREDQPTRDTGLSAAKPAPRRKWRFVAGVAACFLLTALLVLWGSGTFRLKTSEGTIVLEGIPAGAEITVDGETAKIKYGPKGKWLEIQAAPGERKLEIKANGFKVKTQDVTFDIGEREPLRIHLEPLAAAAKLTKPKAGTPQVVPPAAALEALRREQIPPEALKMAGDGDPKRAPASLVGVLGEAVPIHNEKVNGLAFSPNGRWLASGSADKTIMLRDMETGRVSRVLKGHTGPVSSVAFNKDGKTLVSASHDGTLKLWPMEKEAEPETLQPKLGVIWALAASPDGRFLAAGGAGGAIKLWKWGQWDKPVDLTALLPGKVHALAFSPDGELLASGESDGPDARVRLYQTSDGKLTRSWAAGKSRINALAFHRDGKWLATAGGCAFVKLWEVASGKLVAEHGNWTQFTALAFHPDGKTLYACLGGYLGHVFDLPAMKTSAGWWQLMEPPSVMAVAYSPDGKFLVFGTDSGGVHVWDTTKLEKQLPKWEKQLPKHGHSHYITALAVSPDGRTVLSGGDDNALRRWDVARPKESQLLHRFDRPIHRVTVSPDGKKYATTASYVWFDASRTGEVWDAATGKRLFLVDPHGHGLHGIAFSPDGKLLAGCGHGYACVHLWDANNGKELHRFPKMGLSLDRPAFSADGKLLAAATLQTKTVKVWDVASGEEVHSWEDVPMCAVALSPDGRLLAAGHVDGAISLWDLSAKVRKKRTLGGHSGRVNVLRFTPDGKTLVSSSDDGTIRLWNPERERSLRELIQLGPAKRRLVIELDPSGKYVFAAGHSPVIYVLRLPPGEDKTQVEPAADRDRRAAEWVLSIGGKVQLVQGGGFVATKDLPQGDIQLSVVSLNESPNVSDAGLANLKDLTNLTHLYMGSSPVTDAGLANLTGCKNLSVLALDSTKIRDAGLVSLKSFANLKNLSMHNTQVSDAGMGSIKDCKNLTGLDLSLTQITDAGLKSVEALTNLQLLQVYGTKVSADGVKKLAAALPRCKIRWDGGVIEPAVATLSADQRKALEWVLAIGGKLHLQAAGKDHRLKPGDAIPDGLLTIIEINLHGLQAVDDDTVENLKALPTLSRGSLGLSFTHVGDAGLAKLASYPSLARITGLNLERTPITDDAFVHIAKFSKLESIGLPGTQVSAKGLAHLKGLKWNNVTLMNCPQIKDDAMDVVADFKTLKRLDLTQTTITDAGLARVATLPELNWLLLNGGPRITDAGLEHLAKCKALRRVEMHGCQVTKAGLKKLAAAHPDLRIDWDGGVIEPNQKSSLAPRYKNSLGMQFALVPKGKSWLGGGGGKVGDKEVEFKDDFYLGVYEVTQEEWEKIMGAGTNPSRFSRYGANKERVKHISDAELKRFPVENVSSNEAREFLGRLNERDKQTSWLYRLPTEAEWDYACRGGPMADKGESTFHYYFDKPTNTLLPDQANWEHGKGLNRTCKVGLYKPNRLGLYDMHGNVFEWCGDNEDSVRRHALRGGGACDGAGWLAANFRRAVREPTLRSHDTGLRVARVLAGKATDNGNFPPK